MHIFICHNHGEEKLSELVLAFLLFKLCVRVEKYQWKIFEGIKVYEKSR